MIGENGLWRLSSDCHTKHHGVCTPTTWTHTCTHVQTQINVIEKIYTVKDQLVLNGRGSCNPVHKILSYERPREAQKSRRGVQWYTLEIPAMGL